MALFSLRRLLIGTVLTAAVGIIAVAMAAAVHLSILDQLSWSRLSDVMGFSGGPSMVEQMHGAWWTLIAAVAAIFVLNYLGLSMQSLQMQ